MEENFVETFLQMFVELWQPSVESTHGIYRRNTQDSIESFEKRPFFQKHVNFHFATVRLVLVYVGESLSFVWALRIWNPMEIRRTLTSCHGLFSK